jgi:hypothetical protein
MTKTKITILSLAVVLLLSGIGITAFVFLQPKKTIAIEKTKSSVTFTQSYSSLTKKSNFENPKKIIASPEIVESQSDSNPKKFTDGTGMSIKETNLNNYSKGRDESLIYSDDFVNANCESYILTINAAENCYITFRKEILESEVPKIRVSIVLTENPNDSENPESILNCQMLSITQNPDKNALSCTTDNLRLKNGGNYNLILTVAGDVLTNALEKNIEVLTVAEFQQKYSEQVDN